MGEVVLIITIIFGSIAITTLGCVWMGTSYFAKKKGLKKGASQREVEALHQKVNNVHEEIDVLKNEVKRLIEIAKGVGE